MDPENFCYWLINEHISEVELSLLFPNYRLIKDDDEVYLDESIEEESTPPSIDLFHLEDNSIICFSSIKLYYNCDIPTSTEMNINIMKTIGSSIENKFQASIYQLKESGIGSKIVDYYYTNGNSKMDTENQLSNDYKTLDNPFEIIYALQNDYFGKEITQEDPDSEGFRFLISKKS